MNSPTLLKTKRCALFSALAAVLVVTGLTCLFATVQYRKSTTTNEAPRARTIVYEKHLPSGRFCRATLKADRTAAGRAHRLNSVQITIDGQPVHVPTNAFADLSDVAVGDGISIAEFADRTFLLLSGGSLSNRWEAKLTVCDEAVIERDLHHPGAAPLSTRYGGPAQVQYGTIPIAQLEKSRQAELKLNK